VSRLFTLASCIAFAAVASGTAACSETAPQDPASDGIEGDVQDFTTGPKLTYDEYTVLFTNPTCKKYEYPANQEVLSNAGVRLTHKPKDAFCASADGAASGARDSSPQKKLLEWIKDPETKEVFLAYLSFSNKIVAQELCTAIQQRNVKVTMVLDRETDLAQANFVLGCQPGNADPTYRARLELRGHDATIGFAHNKIFMVNPRSDKPRIVFSSGNMTSGIVLHHENWHFLRVKGSTHFAKAHVCVMDGMLDHYRTKQEYSTYIKSCRDAAGVGEEADLKSFFVPGDGGRAGQHIKSGIQTASFIGINAHRFSYRLIRTELERRLTGQSPPEARLVVDDDLWWAGQGEETGPNTPDEAEMVKPLAEAGLKVRYMETNHGAKYLHHNKFMVFKLPQGDAVFAGAGNFTGTAFTDNFENFYYITVPHVVQAMKEQQEHLWELATPEENLPKTNVLPPTN